MRNCVIDATMGFRDGMFVFCPIEFNLIGEFSVISGLNYIGSTMPENHKLVGIVHEGGQSAVEQFCQQHEEELTKLKASIAR